ncbi:MAG: DUF389 domain-containing protein [Actinomycetota bacterium]
MEADGTEGREFEDLDPETADEGIHLDLSQVAIERVLRIVVGIAVAVAIMVWPSRTDRILVSLIGGFAVFSAISLGWSALLSRSRRRADLLLAVVGLVGGGLLLAFPDRSVLLVGRLSALVLVALALRQLRGDIARRGADGLAWPITRTLAVVFGAGLLAAFPSELLAAATAMVAAGWAAVGVLLLGRTADGAVVDDSVAGSRAALAEWLDERAKTTTDRRQLYDKILYEGPTLRTRLARFFTLMTLASAIATMGVITDSTAVVIGAMLIAPLMTPLMAVAVSVVMGWPNRLSRSVSIAVAGVVLSIMIGLLLGSVAPATIDVATNSQILGRASPTILDLMTAVAAGAAGAYGLSRPDVSDALPGVAIAISLVPPLSVVGVAWSQGAWADGNGALLLFVTNALAIIVVGGVTFVLTGVTPLRRVAEHQHRVRTASASIAGLVAIVIGALSINGAELAANALEIGTAREVVADWVDEAPDHDLVEVRLDGEIVTAVIIGPPTDPPTADELRTALVDSFGDDVVADVRLLVQRRDIADGSG